MLYNIISDKVVIFAEDLEQKMFRVYLLTGFPGVESIKQKDYDDK